MERCDLVGHERQLVIARDELSQQLGDDSHDKVGRAP